jgi:leucyl aminopeptidase
MEKRDRSRHEFWSFTKNCREYSGLAQSKVGFFTFSPGQKEGFLMKLEQSSIAVWATVLGMTLASPSSGMAAMNKSATQNTSLYAQATPSNPREVDDATLKRAAAAYIKVRDISDKAQRAINTTDDTARKQQLMAESESTKVEVVKEEGMEPQQYNNVIQMVRDDNSLQQKFLSYVQEIRHAKS